jgi:hypothetical protein
VYYEPHEELSASDALFIAAAGPVATACVGLLAIAVTWASRAEIGQLVYDVACANVAIAIGLLITNLLRYDSVTWKRTDSESGTPGEDRVNPRSAEVHAYQPSSNESSSGESTLLAHG